MKQGVFSRSIGSWFIFAFGLWVGGTPGAAAIHPRPLNAETCSESRRREIHLVALDDKGGLIENLRKEDLTISEDNTDVEILSLERKTGRPLSVAIFIDTSVSQENVLPGTKLAATKFVESVLSAGSDTAALVSFMGEATVEQELTTDLDKLRAAINRVEFVPPAGYVPGGIIVGRMPPNRTQMLPGATAIWDAIGTTTEPMFRSAGNGNRVIVLLTDGVDTISKMKMRDAVRLAAINNVTIFSVGISDDRVTSVDRDSLRKVSEETGGHAFFPKKIADLEAIFQSIEKELRSQYSLTYCGRERPPNASPRKVKIDITNQLLRKSKPQFSYRRYLQ